MAPYTFSDQVTDLAIVSLDQQDRSFAEHLLERGHEPIALSDVADAPSAEGTEVFTVGYPSVVSVLGNRDHLHSAERPWTSVVYSLPAFAFGRVSMLHDALSYFLADMTIYPGNSGGPVIENDRLVGLVISQPCIEVEGNRELRVRAPLAYVTKANAIRELVAVQASKDAQGDSTRR